MWRTQLRAVGQQHGCRGEHYPWQSMAFRLNTFPSSLHTRCSQVIDDLDEIHFTMKKARQVLRDMARGIMTDK